MKSAILAFVFSCASLPLLAAPRPSADGVEIVAQLYRYFAWEAVIVEPDATESGLIDQPRAVLERYFDSNLSTLILADRRCAAETGEICQLDFMPMWDSQDPAATEVRITAGATADKVDVTFRYPGDDKVTRLDYRVAKTRQGWRITDIHYASGHSLLGVLKATP